MKKEIKNKKRNNLNYFLKNMQPLDSFSDIDTTEYIQSLRGKNRLLWARFILGFKPIFLWFFSFGKRTFFTLEVLRYSVVS